MNNKYKLRLEVYKEKYASGILVFGLTIALVIAGIYLENRNTDQFVLYNDFISMAESEQVSEVVLDNSGQITFYADGEKFITDHPRTENFKEYLLTRNIAVKENNGTAVGIGQYVLSLAVIGGVIFTVYKISAKNSDKTKSMAGDAAQVSEKSIDFQNVAGNKEAKEQVMDIVDFIKEPEKYSKYGARMPRGVIFYGPPGTGKTLLAKAVAGEAGVPFYAVSGSDFVQMYVGVGASRIRELFKKAKAHEKAVIFIDEIDALGKKRAGNSNGASDERDQTLNALLTEMSGFNENEGIVIIAATNRLDTLDEALLRPGRFDRHVEIALPDKNARKEILLLHSMNKPTAENMDFEDIASQTVYFSGAMLENLMNESAIYAAKEKASYIDRGHIDKAFYTIIAGMEKLPDTKRAKKEMAITAYHESGHALITKLVLKEHVISKISIIPSTKGAGGFCISIPPDRMYCTKSDLEGQIMMLLGGRAAEEIIFGKEGITTGASNDLERASQAAADYLAKYAMGDKMMVRDYQDETLKQESEMLLKTLYERAKILLLDHKALLDRMAEELIRKETLNTEEIEELTNIA